MSDHSKFSRGWCSPERYVQGPGEFDHLKFYTDKFGTRVAAFIDSFLYSSYTERINKIYDDGKHQVETLIFDTEVTEDTIDEKTQELLGDKPDVIVGIGGGKTIDVAKAVGTKLELPFIIVPTIAATDAPTSSLSVIYRKDGSHAGEFFYDHSPRLLVVDSKIIAEAPSRFLVSGMGDALATLIEADSTRKSNTPNLVYHKDGGFRQTLAGQAIARACYESLMKYGVQAKIACDNNVVTDALENIIETNILLSGLGFENNATSAAHSINDGLTAMADSSKTMHGEKVAFGCIVQLMAECADKEYLEEVLSFCMSVGLPVCLEDVFVENTDENIRTVAQASMHSNWCNMPFEVNEDLVFASIKTADAYGKEFKEKWIKKKEV
ncbi:MAG: glycerol dehydrogenase [Eubacteriales bacterium]|nr:glycerol dehydrogenase [Eubacteriales bacterium]